MQYQAYKSYINLGTDYTIIYEVIAYKLAIIFAKTLMTYFLPDKATNHTQKQEKSLI